MCTVHDYVAIVALGPKVFSQVVVSMSDGHGDDGFGVIMMSQVQD